MSESIRSTLCGIGILSLVFVPHALAQSIPIDNPSFEDDVLMDGDFISSVAGWMTTSGGGDGTLNPTSAAFPAEAPDGENVAYVNATGNFVHQALTSNLAADRTYTLQVEVGRRVGNSFPGYRVQLLAGGALLAEDDSSLTPTEGNFLTSLVTYKSTGQEAQLGQPLEIRLLSAGIQVSFDDVRLNSSPCCINPPSGMRAWWPFDELAGTTATDIVGSNDGTHINGPIPTAGKVDGALSFDGSNDRVEAPDDPSLDFGTGDLSIDVWVRTMDNTGVVTIADKRTEGNGVRGYHFYLFNGSPGFQLADRDGSTICSTSGTVSCTNWVAGGNNVADGAWHHIAVTVDRDNPSGLIFYVDGVAVSTFDPTVRPLSLDNDNPLSIGRLAIDTSNYWSGELDELEFFDRVLAPEEVTALAAADDSGKCKDRISVKWDVPFCLGQDSKTTTVLVCNDSPVDREYDFLLIPVPQQDLVRGCTIDGPDSFEFIGPPQQSVPPAATVTVPARTCRNLPITIDRPTQMVQNRQVGCYEAIFTNTSTGAEIRQRGSVQDWRECCSVGNDDEVVNVGSDTATDITFNILNTNGGPLSFDYRIEAMPLDGAESSLSLDGESPGIPVTGSVSFDDGETVDITFTATFVGDDLLATEDILFLVDTTGGGDFEALTSIRTSPPSATGLLLFYDGFESGDLSLWDFILNLP